MTHHQIEWGDVVEGQDLAGFAIALTFAKIALTPMATWDFFPAHFDPAFARGQGQQDIYLNTTALQGFADRIVTQWAGPQTFIARRRMAMVRSAFPGDTLTGGGKVIRKSLDDSIGKVFLKTFLATAAGEVCVIETTVHLPLERHPSLTKAPV